MSSAHRLEARSPFLDKDLLEYIALLPDEAKIHHFTLKYILRKSFQGIVPDAIIKRKKHGFGVPLAKWFREDLQSYIKDQPLANNSKIHYYVSKERLKQIFGEHLAGTKDWGQQLWLLLTFELWLKKWDM